MPLFLPISLCLIVALGLGLVLGWVLKSQVAKKYLLNLEETWAARLYDKQHEWELTSSKLGSLLNSLQNSYNTTQATMHVREASLAESQAKLATQKAELDRTREALRRESQEWEARYNALMEDKEAEIRRLLSQVRELEPFTMSVQEGEARLRLITRDKDVQINQLQRRLRELERPGTQTKHWKFSILLQERELAIAKFAPLHFQA